MPSLKSGLLGAMGAFLLVLPVEAANLQSWQFDQPENRLTFTTDVQVEPRARLVFNPTRLVIELPDTQVESATLRRDLDTGLQEIRLSQPSAELARIVVELEPGYTLDPQALQVRGTTNRSWYVQLPPIEPIAGAGGQETVAQNRSGTTTEIQAISATADGFFIRTSGEIPEIRYSQDRDRKLTLELLDSRIAADLDTDSLPNNRYSVERWNLSQDGSKVRITLTLGADSPDWRARITNINATLRGISILPDGVSIREIPDRPPRQTATAPQNPSSQPQVPPARPTPRLPRNSRPPQERIVVVLDPGHGGRDPGAVGIGGLQEKQVILPIALEVASLLRQEGIEVVMTRDRDFELDLAPRVQIAERANANLFVSIHANAISLSRPDVNGLETYYYSSNGARFARTVHDNILNRMGMRDRRVRQARFYVIRNTSMPAILIEVGFVTGAEDIHNLRSPQWRSRMAQAIAEGIQRHVQNEFQ